MKGVHPLLATLITDCMASSPVAFMVTEGLRTPERQAALVKAGASRTLNSRHLTGHAVDIAALIDGRVRWDWPLYPRIAAHIKALAAARGIALIWGGDWPKLRDGPHFELDRKVYP